MTVLEIMIVLAIIGAGAMLVNRGFRTLTRQDLVEGVTELATVMKRTSQLAIEHGEMHRILFDVDKQLYIVEACQGSTSIMRNEQLRPDEDEVKRAKDRGEQKLRDLPPDAFAADPEEAAKRVTALAASHVADKVCAPATDVVSGDSSGKGFSRALRADKGIKFKNVYVQHLERPADKGQVAIYFFPQGQSEKAIVELTDGTETFTILVHGLTGRVELRDGEMQDPDEHMLRNVLGDKDKRPRGEK